jgi:hypothetical protein
VRRALTWLAGAVGLAALARHRARRRAAADGPVVEDPAEELRRKLATQRDDEPVDAPDDEPSEDAAPPVDLAERRAEVHAKAQEAIDSMREGETEGDGPDDEPVA